MADLFMERRATFSQEETCRLTLERQWGPGKTICFCGLNPSKADALRDDPTCGRWVYYARAWGFDRFVAVNKYPYRSPKPSICRAWVADWDKRQAWDVRDALQHNLEIIEREARAAQMFVACWGNCNWPGDHEWTEQVIEAAQQSGHAIYCFGTTKDGSPKHPMARGHHRIPDDQQPILWRAA